jgi:hypothetical protein
MLKEPLRTIVKLIYQNTSLDSSFHLFFAGMSWRSTSCQQLRIGSLKSVLHRFYGYSCWILHFRVQFYFSWFCTWWMIKQEYISRSGRKQVDQWQWKLNCGAPARMGCTPSTSLRVNSSLVVRHHLLIIRNISSTLISPVLFTLFSLTFISSRKQMIWFRSQSKARSRGFNRLVRRIKL